MAKSTNIVSLDVGEKRIGVAVADTSVKIAVPFDTVQVDGNEIDSITKIFKNQAAEVLVIGYPRNQSGHATAQTQFVQDFASKLSGLTDKIVFQDESLTSVMAEQQLASHGRKYEKSDIDAMAAAIILQDYIEENYA